MLNCDSRTSQSVELDGGLVVDSRGKVRIGTFAPVCRDQTLNGTPQASGSRESLGALLPHTASQAHERSMESTTPARLPTSDDRSARRSTQKKVEECNSSLRGSNAEDVRESTQRLLPSIHPPSATQRNLSNPYISASNCARFSRFRTVVACFEVDPVCCLSSKRV